MTLKGSVILVLTAAKIVNFKLSGEDFFMNDINLKNNGAIVIPWFSTICGKVRTSFGDICKKFTSGRLTEMTQDPTNV